MGVCARALCTFKLMKRPTPQSHEWLNFARLVQACGSESRSQAFKVQGPAD